MTLRAFCFVVCMLAGAEALAQASADFVSLDRNRDGQISKVEALADAEVHKRFAAFDMDRDGLLSEVEYAGAIADNQKRMLQDGLITARVKAALLAEKGLQSLAISVQTYEGQVRLSGFLKAPELVSRAGRVSAAVTGVRSVHNDLSVR